IALLELIHELVPELVGCSASKVRPGLRAPEPKSLCARGSVHSRDIPAIRRSPAAAFDEDAELPACQQALSGGRIFRPTIEEAKSLLCPESRCGFGAVAGAQLAQDVA